MVAINAQVCASTFNEQCPYLNLQALNLNMGSQPYHNTTQSCAQLIEFV